MYQSYGHPVARPLPFGYGPPVVHDHRVTRAARHGHIVPGLIEYLYLQLEDGQSPAWRVAVLELSSELVGEETFLCTHLICFQGIV